MAYKKCKNDPHRKYSGKEPSPKGDGWCAHAEPKGKKLIGKDRRLWYVHQNEKNGVKNWRRVAQPTTGQSPKSRPTRRPAARRSKSPTSPKSRSTKKIGTTKFSRRKKCGDDPRPRHKNSPPYAARHCPKEDRTGRDGFRWVSVQRMRKGSPYYKWQGPFSWED